MKNQNVPVGEWIITQVADRIDVEEGRSDKPCWHIKGPDGVEGFYWGFGDRRRALTEWLKEYWGYTYPYVVTTERYFT